MTRQLGSSASTEEALRVLAWALAPYLAEELEQLRALEAEALAPDYDLRTCRRFVAELGDEVLPRAETLFRLLSRERVIDSLQLAEALGATPRGLSGFLTTPLKRRAKTLGLPLPFAGGLGAESYGGIMAPSPDMDPQRTHWQDRDGIAKRMLRAIEEERAARAPDTSSAAPARPRPSPSRKPHGERR